MARLRLAAFAALIAAGVPGVADAFCGFYVAGAGQQMVNDATQVVLVREGTRTVLSMQNNYKGPPASFAMVVPVPVVLKDKDVKTLPRAVFDKVEAMGAPRLVEYWEMDPCAREEYDKRLASVATAPMAEAKSAGSKPDDFGVTVEAQFVVGEYEIVILSAKDSTGLDAWLRAAKYNIPAGAEPLLRPYVESGMKFFVAKVDPSKVKFENDRAELSPLRFHYDSEQFNLPIRLGLANSSGTQDLIVNILATGQRYEVANYRNVTIPTNLDVTNDVRDKFGAFYAALFDATIARHPGAVVTEYAWDAATCDPCPGPTLDYYDFATLGADVLQGAEGDAPPAPVGGRPGARRWSRGIARSFVLTRLHARYGKDITNDLEFVAAPPITGGREWMDPNTRALEAGARPASFNNFQGRYAIRHAWTGPIRCTDPIRGRWGGPPPDARLPASGAPGPKPALDLAFAPRGAVELAKAVRSDIPELAVKAAAAATVAASNPPAPQPAPNAKGKSSGCGCGAADASGGLVLGLLLFAARRRRR